MDKDKITNGVIVALVVAGIICLLSYVIHFIGKTNKETKEIQKRINEPPKVVVTETPQTEGKDSLSDLKKSLATIESTHSTYTGDYKSQAEKDRNNPYVDAFGEMSWSDMAKLLKSDPAEYKRRMQENEAKLKELHKITAGNAREFGESQGYGR